MVPAVAEVVEIMDRLGAGPLNDVAKVRVSRDREHGFQRIVSNDFRGS